MHTEIDTTLYYLETVTLHFSNSLVMGGGGVFDLICFEVSARLLLLYRFVH